ncbi:aminotransferase class I/II-fold pyridoxal phosphate-dependent enzyme [Candidatus Gracilibacteria bacterium]|nr:aminotransferase class I/II-fold pyridoxal phosphate-dependent enzyme [Candidatus Gracilibacteria bacterium]
MGFFSFGKAARTDKNSDVIAHAQRILAIVESEIASAKGSREKVFKKLVEVVFEDVLISQMFAGMKIRHTAMCGAVVKEAMEILGFETNDIQLMSYGDVDLPEEIEKVVFGIIDRAHDEHMELLRHCGAGYDLTSRGAPEARTALIEYYDKHYGFSHVQGLKELLSNQSTIVNGGMRALDDFAATFVHYAFTTKKRPRFINPDNTFPTWISVIKNHIFEAQLGEIHSISTDPAARLHLSADDVKTFYGAFSPDDTTDYMDIWCITPVGNPSGTAMTPQQLHETCAKIVEHAPGAWILLDCAYIRTLTEKRAQALMKGIMRDETIRNRIVFLESFSKSHGLCGERIGCFFTTNSELYLVLQNYNTTVSSGNGRYKDALALALAQPTERETEALHELHHFWMKERAGLFTYMMAEKFSDLFDKKQLHITEDQLKEPQGLYLFLKMKKEVDVKRVFLETKCLGVEMKMGSGNYIRFAVCKMKEPLFSKQ